MVDSPLEALRARVGSGDLRETHISWVVLTEDRAYKLKKPVDFGFLDFSSPERRRRACEDELRLNRRLASDVYLGLLELDGGEVAVEMRRLPDADRADERLGRGALTDEHLSTAARRLARFHGQEAARSPRIADRGRAEAVRKSVVENFEQTRESLPRILSAEEASELERWQLDFLDDQAALLDARAGEGRVVEGHGDLRLDHFYFDEAGELRILDCVEFSEGLRDLDAASDIAFFAMDLGVHGRPDLAERFLALYARETGDFGLYEVIDFYESYRAMVRGKIACFGLRAAESEQQRERQFELARRHFRLALASERRPLVPPTLVAVMGTIAAGKSTLADALSARIGAPVVSTDRTRKRLFGAAPTDRLPEGAYTAEASEQTYRAARADAARVLRSGRTAVFDATLGREAERTALAELAAEAQVPVRFVVCDVPEPVARARLAARASDPEVVSDARANLYDAFMARWTGPTERPPEEVRTVTTDRPLDRVLDSLNGFVPTYPSTQRR